MMRNSARTVAVAAVLLLAFAMVSAAGITVGADRLSRYLPLLRGKGVALFSNHTGLLSDGRHTLDVLIDSGIDVRMLFGPEHGFRGTADAGESVAASRDPKTGIEIVSLYGTRRFPTNEQMRRIDVIVCDIQDVGVRFYTYYCTMLDLMKSAARAGKQFVVLDRPNPIGMMVDGPLLDMSLASGVGRLPIPVAHGLTLGEMAEMVVGEGWLGAADSLRLDVVPCLGYTHASLYRLPVAPSPNLPDMSAIYLYPSMCFFEATPLSLGRGTDTPFRIYGHPSLKGKPGCTFSFTPRSRSGARKPPLMDRLCYGRSVTGLSDSAVIARGVDLSYLLEALRLMPPSQKPLLSSFFEKLIGSRRVRQMIDAGFSADEIKASWADSLNDYRRLRAKYLLYPEK